MVAEVIMEKQCENCKWWRRIPGLLIGNCMANRRIGSAGSAYSLREKANPWQDSICPDWIAKEPELKPCPFCGSTNLTIWESTLSNTRHMRCKRCGARGPNATGRYGVIEGWNERL